jgi:hypothetical protein
MKGAATVVMHPTPSLVAATTTSKQQQPYQFAFPQVPINAAITDRCIWFPLPLTIVIIGKSEERVMPHTTMA